MSAGQARGPAKRQATRRAKIPNNPSVPAKRRLAQRKTSSPEPLTPALCAEFTTADRYMRGCRTRSRAYLIIPRNRLALVAVEAFWRKKYSPLVSKGQYNFADVLAAFHAGMCDACLRTWKGRIDQRLDAAPAEKAPYVRCPRLRRCRLMR